MFIRVLYRWIATLLVFGGLTCTSGCLVTQVKWREPCFLPPLDPTDIPRCGSHARAERVYAKAINYEQRGRDACVDLFFEAALLTTPSAHCGCFSRGRQLHEAALMKLVVAGQRFKRLDPAEGLTIHRKGQRHWIPISRHGFVWREDDFQRLVPIGHYETNALRVKHQLRGLGVPLVVQRCSDPDRPYLRTRGVFPSTLVMRCDSSDVAANECEGRCAQASPSFVESTSSSPPPCRLELYDPLRIDSIDVNGRPHVLARDTTAPLVYALQGEQFTFLNYFINAEGSDNRGTLYMLEPYQPGKIPLVLIHGLLSDPFTWVELINELLVHPGFMDHYQIWAFEYSTGNSFLSSAAFLREQLAGIRQRYDPQRRDPSMSNIILAGHSMGGLVAKLQITSSGEHLWRSVANRSLDSLRAPDDIRERLRQQFYFEPSPDVTRVVFLATPHQGSNLARRPIGRIGAMLVNMPESQTRAHDMLVRCNPGVFSSEIQDRIPTSIDLLEPCSRLLAAIGCLPAPDHVCMHSIIGDRCWTLLQGKSDGIVPVSSAREPRAVSEKIVKATHSQVKGHPEAINELLYVLQEHLQQCHAFPREPSLPVELELERIQLTRAE